MEIQLLHDDPVNTVLILDGAPIYAIESKGFLQGKTVVRKAHKDMEIEGTSPIAVIEWATFKAETKVQLGEQTRAWDEILYPASGAKWYSESRTFVSPSGATYKWRRNRKAGHLSLLNAAEETVAEYSPGRLGIFGKARKAFINVTQECSPMLDLVVVTWVVMEQNYRVTAAVTAAA